jgi:hypothetical protein
VLVMDNLPAHKAAPVRTPLDRKRGSAALRQAA